MLSPHCESLKKFIKDLPSNSLVKNLVINSSNVKLLYTAGFSADMSSGNGPNKEYLSPGLKKTAIETLASRHGFPATLCSTLLYSSLLITWKRKIITILISDIHGLFLSNKGFFSLNWSYLKHIAHVDDESTGHRVQIQPCPIVLNLQPTYLILQYHR